MIDLITNIDVLKELEAAHAEIERLDAAIAQLTQALEELEAAHAEIKGLDAEIEQLTQALEEKGNE